MAHMTKSHRYKINSISYFCDLCNSSQRGAPDQAKLFCQMQLLSREQLCSLHNMQCGVDFKFGKTDTPLLSMDRYLELRYSIRKGIKRVKSVIGALMSEGLTAHVSCIGTFFVMLPYPRSTNSALKVTPTPIEYFI